jgi:MFS family permease
MPEAPSALTLFRNQNFRMLWIGALASNFGGLVQAVGAAWLMTTLTNSHSMVALVQASVALPIMIFSLLAGVFADNFDRRRVMLVAQSFMLVISIGLAILAFQDLLSPWLLLGLTFLIGCGTALHNPSWQASVGDIVSREELPSAISLNGMSVNLMRSVGPAAGGAIVAVGGVASAFAVNAFSYVAIIAALWLWRPNYPKKHLPREPFGGAFSAGLRYVAMSPNLTKVIIRATIYSFSAIAILALLPLLTHDYLGGGAILYGALLGCFGLGAVCAAFVNAKLRSLFPNETITCGAFVAFALSSLVLSLSHNEFISGGVLFLAGASWVIALSLFNVTIQLSAPRWVVGRALALYQTGLFAGMAVGSWVWGIIAEHYGADRALLYAAVALACGAAIGIWVRLPNFENLNLDPLNHFKEPSLRLDLTQRSGPIMIMLDYEIEQENVSYFLEVMNLRRRIRIRDGAQRWALLRDLENPDIWTETYHVPTWVEYVRHNQRRTQADADVTNRLLNLNRNHELPRVHRMIERQTISIDDDMPLKEL